MAPPRNRLMCSSFTSGTDVMPPALRGSQTL